MKRIAGKNDVCREHLLSEIAVGIYRPGERLPAERELGEAYQVSRSTVRNALNELEELGIVERRPPVGTFVTGEALKRIEQLTAQPPRLRALFVMTTGQIDNPFLQRLFLALKNRMPEGVELTVRTSPTETAIDEQIELIRQTAAEKPDVMILSAADYDRCAEATEEAIAAGIGVVAVDTDVNAGGRACFVGSNNYQIGQEMGSQMASYLPEGGKVAVIQHMLTTTTGIDRTRGVIDALMQAGNIEILGSYCCDNSTLRAQEITTALLEDEPDIRGFVCTNEVCNVGAANALVELGMGGKVFVVGCDNSQRQIALLEQNIIQAIVIQRPFNMGYMAVQQAVRVAQGEKPEDFVEVACVLITRENMYTQENQKLLFPVMEQ